MNRNRLLLTLWVISSLGIAGIVTAMAYKPQITKVQKIAPTHNIDRLLKTDKFKLPSVKVQPKPTPAPAWTRLYWHA